MAKDTTDTAEPVATGTLTQLFLGLVWLGTTMYAAHATITGSGENVSGALAAAVAALPGVVAATLVTGASIGAAAGPRFRSAGGRLLAGLALGALFGLAAAAGIRFAYGGGASIMALAITVGAASIVGGALAVLPGEVLKAGLWGTTWVFFAGVIFGVLQPNLVKLLGSGEAANTRFVLGQSLVTGLVAASVHAAVPASGAQPRAVVPRRRRAARPGAARRRVAHPRRRLRGGPAGSRLSHRIAGAGRTLRLGPAAPRAHRARGGRADRDARGCAEEPPELASPRAQAG